MCVMNFLRNIVEFFQRINSYYYYYNGIKGDALPANAANYVEREVDDLLYEFIQGAEPQSNSCYVFGTPQMGKSSLRLRTAKKLEEQGWISISVCLSILEKNVTEERLYSSLTEAIYQKLRAIDVKATTQLQTFWQKQQDDFDGIKIQEFIKQVIHVFNNRKILLFIDDVQNVKQFSWLVVLLSNLRIANFVLVLLGSVYPSTLLQNFRVLRNSIRILEIPPLSGECQSLQARLAVASKDTSTLFQEILHWTGGQPFLTQFLCSLALKSLKIGTSNVTTVVSALVQDEIVQNWRSKTALVTHFEAIGNYYIRGDPEDADLRFYALETYKQVLKYPKATRFSERSLTQRELLISGLVTKSNSFIDVANCIYKEIFNLSWIEDIKQQIVLNSRRVIMGELNLSICNRDFKFLVSKSASMLDPMSTTDRRERFYVVKDTLKGNVRQVLNYSEGQEPNKKIITKSVTLGFFNLPEKVSKSIYKITEHSEVDTKFNTNVPGGDAFIAPTFENLANSWLDQREPGQGCIFSIYVDTKIDDYDQFVNVIRKVSRQLENHSEMKILIVGVGDAVKSEQAVRQFLELDLNGYAFEDKYGNPCNIVIFKRKEDVDEHGIVKCIYDQLIPQPELGLDEWVRDEYFNLYQELKQKYNIE